MENLSGLKCLHCGQEIALFGRGGAEKMTQEAGIELLGRIPIFPKVVAAGDSGRVLDFGGEAREVFLRLAERV